MSKKMKILFGYDGSDSANAMLDELQFAGLPDEAEAIVVSVAELTFPPAPIYGAIETDLTPGFPFDIDATRKLAFRACERLLVKYPNWQVSNETYVGSPAQEIIKKADKWKPDLIIVGSQGLSAVGRLFFGSVSQKIVTEARCSVRVNRERLHNEASPIKIIIGIDGSPDSNAAIHSVAARNWPKGAEARLVTAFHHGIAPAVADPIAQAGNLKLSKDFKNSSGFAQGIQQALQQALLAELRAKGLKVTTLTVPGDPKRVLIDEAEQWGADAIFLGSRSYGKLKRFLLGSVSTAVVSRAHCSVEVVRSINEI
jgi:nucleotide-binding universal stress UspA family protein